MASTERAVLAGGCFWGAQDLIRRQPGVISSRVGYSGGDVPNATYRNHGTHAEAVEILLHDRQIPFEQDERLYRLADGREIEIPLLRFEADDPFAVGIPGTRPV